MHYALMIELVQSDRKDNLFNSLCWDSFFATLPNYALMQATIVNLAIWINFVLGTKAIFEGTIKKYRRFRKILLIGLAITLIIFIFIACILMTV